MINLSTRRPFIRRCVPGLFATKASDLRSTVSPFKGISILRTDPHLLWLLAIGLFLYDVAKFIIIPTLETQELNIRIYAEQFKGNTYDEAIILLGLKLPKEPIQDPLDYENEDLYYLDPWAVGACLNTAFKVE